MQWFYIDEKGDAKGPCSIQEVKAANMGRDDYHVFRDGMDDWRMVSAVLDFHQPAPVIPRSIAPAPKPEPTSPPRSAGWQGQPVTEKQKAMLVLSGLDPRTAATKGEASEAIERCKESGEVPTPENQKKADRLFRDLDKAERKNRSKLIVADIEEAMKRLLKKKQTVEDAEGIKLLIDEKAEELKELCDERISELEDEAFNAEADEDSVY
jgi:hypothetical protein